MFQISNGPKNLQQWLVLAQTRTHNGGPNGSSVLLRWKR